MDGKISVIEREMLTWPGVTSEPGRFGAVAFRYGKREIEHIHRDLKGNLPLTTEMRADKNSRGRARAHRAGVRGYISRPLEDREVVSAVLEILGRNNERAKAAAEQRRGSPKG